MTKYQATVLLKAIIGFPVVAETPEEALKLARALLPDLKLVNSKLEYIDGRETLMGIDHQDWSVLDD